MSASDKKKRSCANCRKIKRKCDGGNPCANCVRKSARCEYNTTDRRSQRFSVGYIKSLETNNDVLEDALAELVALRDDPEKLAAKLDTLTVSFPKKIANPEGSVSQTEGDDDFELVQEDVSDKPFVTEHDQYFGAGSVYLSSGAPTQNPEPLLISKSESASRTNAVVTLEEDFDYVAGLVRGYFEDQYQGTLHTMFDSKRILHELENRNFSGPFLNAELVYAICANCESLTYEQADAYCDYVLKRLFSDTITPSIAVSQSYTLLSLHCASKGQVSKAWLFAGIGIRVGIDVGFDMAHGQTSCPTGNRCFMGTVILDQYFAMSLGRRPTISQDSVPVLRLEGESDVDFLSVKYSVELVEWTRNMIRSTYQPVTFDKDPKINYLLKFNRSKVFNMKLLKWKQNLDPACSWSYASLKASKNLANENHSLKFLYYYIVIFLNKPFLHVPRQHSTVYLIEEMSREVYVIVHSKLLKIEERIGAKVHGRESDDYEPRAVSNKFCSASMDICVVLLLAKVLLALITSQPEHYINLEKHFRTFVHYINYINMRKYDDVGRPLAKLLKRFEEFKAQRKADTTYSDDKSSDLCESAKSSPPTSESYSCDSRLAEECSNGSVQNLNQHQEAQKQLQNPFSGPPPNPSEISNQDPESFAFDPWWQELNRSNSQNPGWQVNPNAPSETVSKELPNRAVSQNAQMWNPPSNQYFESLTAENLSAVQGLPQQSYNGTNQAGIFSYDFLQKATDPVDQELNQLFSNDPDDFWMKKEGVDWDGLFRDQGYVDRDQMQL